MNGTHGPVEGPTHCLRAPGSTARPAAPKHDPFPQVGDVLGEFVLLRELGRGTTGRVFLARQPSLGDRPVVLKLTPHAGAEPASLGRLLHTHVVPLLFAFDVPQFGLQALAMPYLGGASLSAVLRRLSPMPPARRRGADLLAALDALQPEALPSPWREGLARASYVSAACWLAACLADALQHAHERGLVHLDVKPGNVLLAGDGHPLLLDFHLAQPPLSAGATPAAFGGTLEYAAPEHASALLALRDGVPSPTAVDGRADVYSLGVVLREMLAGGSGPRRNPEVPASLADLVARATADDPARRYPDAASLAADLRRHLADEPLAGVRERDWVERWGKWRRRRPFAFARASLLLLGLLAMAGGVALTGWHLLAQQRLAEAALADGRDRLRRGDVAGAEAAFRRGLAAGWHPGDGPTRAALADEADGLSRRAADRQRLARLARELAELADEMRFGEPSPRQLERCAELWRQRAALSEGWDDERRRDFVDLVALWGERAPDGGARLAEAKRLTGGEGDESFRAYRRGRESLGRGRLREAEAELARAVALRPGAFGPNFHHGVCLHRLGRHADAVAAFRACLALSPASAASYVNRALALGEMGRGDEAMADVDRALALDGRLASARLQRGVLLAKAGRDVEAEGELREALRLGADPFRANVDLAWVARRRGDTAACEAHLAEALRHRPHDAATREALRGLR